MKQLLLITFLLLFSSTLIMASDFGLLADYNVNGISMGQTKMQGNLKVQLKANLKRLTGNIFYQEPGNPFPELDEKDIIVNFNKKKKHIFTTASEQWFSSSIDEDYSILNEKKVRIKVTRKAKEITTVVTMKLPPALGGNQKYTIKFQYNSAKPGKEDKAVQKFKKPTCVDLLSIFIDNEELIELISKKLPKDNFRVPDKFSILWKQGTKTQLNVKASLSVKMMINMYKDDFKPLI